LNDNLGKKGKKVWDNLYKRELQSKFLFGNGQQEVKLSKEEVDAAHRLAAALANYDKDDFRSLKFYNIQVKEKKGRPANSKPINKWNIFMWNYCDFWICLRIPNIALQTFD